MRPPLEYQIDNQSSHNSNGQNGWPVWVIVESICVELPEFKCAVDEHTRSISESEKGNRNESSCANKASGIAWLGEVEESSGDSSEQDSEVKPFLININISH